MAVESTSSGNAPGTPAGSGTGSNAAAAIGGRPIRLADVLNGPADNGATAAPTAIEVRAGDVVSFDGLDLASATLLLQGANLLVILPGGEQILLVNFVALADSAQVQVQIGGAEPVPAAFVLPDMLGEIETAAGTEQGDPGEPDGSGADSAGEDDGFGSEADVEPPALRLPPSPRLLADDGDIPPATDATPAPSVPQELVLDETPAEPASAMPDGGPQPGGPSAAPTAGGNPPQTGTPSPNQPSVGPPSNPQATANAAPTLSQVAEFAGSEDAAVPFSFAELLAASDAADSDGTVTGFRVESVLGGSLTVDGAPAVPGQTWITAGSAAVWTPTADLNGTLAAFTVLARDDDGAVSANPVVVKVQLDPVNDAPATLLVVAGQAAQAGAAFVFQLPPDPFGDIDGDALTLGASLADGSPLPAWLDFDPQTGSFSGTPGGIDAGQVLLRVTATDPGGLAATADFMLTVTADPVQLALTGNNDNFTVPDPTLVYEIDALAGNDKVTAGAAPDTVQGGAGKDTLSGEGGNDSLDGGTEDDRLFGGEGDDTLDGGAGGDALFGEAGDDVLLAGGAGESYDGGAGTDTLLGGGGDVVLEQFKTTDSVEVVDVGGARILGTGGNNTLDFRASTLVGVAAVDGAAGNDKLYGIAAGDSLLGGDGKDSLYGEAGDDTLEGGGDSDRLYGGEGADLLAGGAGKDSLYGEAGDDSMYGVEADDRLFGGDGNDVLDGGAGDDSLDGEAGDDVLFAGGAGDSYDGGAGTDTLLGGGGDVVLAQFKTTDSVEVVDVGGARILGTGGNNTLDFRASTLVGVAAVDGAAGNDKLYGTVAGDSLLGGEGQDKLYGDGGSDTLAGGEDRDSLYGEAGHDSLQGGEGDDRLFGDDGDDVLDGGSGEDTLDGGAGNDVLMAGGAGDRYAGGDGTDTLLGGGGDIVLERFRATDSIEVVDALGARVLGTDGNNTLDFRASTFSGVAAVDGGAGNDKLYGTVAGDSLLGGDGKDSLYGEAGDDTLEGGGESDRLYGGAGADRLDGGAGEDSLYGEGGDDVLQAGEAGDRYFGGDGSDTLLGSDGDDEIVLNRFQGAESVEVVDGGAGFDRVLGNDGNNRLDFRNATLTGVEEIDGGGGNDKLFGSAGGETMFGGAGNDTLSGEAGDDWLDGGIGVDSLNGGVGDDSLVFDVADKRIDGGLGDDFLLADGAGAIDLDKVRNIEHLDMRGGSADSVTLSAADVLGATDGDNLLFVDGDATDSVVLAGAGWQQVGSDTSQSQVDYDFSVWTDGSATLNINTLVDVQTPDVPSG